MPVPANISDLSTTAGSNPPSGSETPQEGDNHLRAAYSFIKQISDKLDGTTPTDLLTDTLQFSNFADANGNRLDWYEENTFTPTLSGATTAGAGTYTLQEASFTRIGNRVVYSFRVRVSAHTGSGFIKLGGFTYAPASASSSALELIIGSGYVNNTTASRLCVVTVSSTGEVLLLVGDTSTTVAVPTINSGTNYVAVSGEYRV